MHEIKEEIAFLIQRALRQLVANRAADSAFADEVDVRNERHYFSTLEGLDALLIPLVNLPKNHCWIPVVSECPELVNIIVDDANYVLNCNNECVDPPPTHGEPYFLVGAKGREEPYWTSECSSFTVSVLTNLLELKTKYELGRRPTLQNIRQCVSQNLTWISRCRRDDRGWSWLFESDAHPWPTWSMLDTLEEVFRSTGARLSGLPQLKKHCDETAASIVADFSSSAAASYGGRWQQRVVKKTEHGLPYDVETALDSIRLMLGAGLYKKDWEVFPLAETLFKWAAISAFDVVDYKFYFKEKGENIWDSSLLPSTFRALLLLAQSLRRKMSEKLDASLDASHEFVIQRVYAKCNESLIQSGRFAGLWGATNQGKRMYELYYTERMLEALTEFWGFLRPSEASQFYPVIQSNNEKNGATGTRASGKSGGRKEVRRALKDAPPNEVDKYTTWIPDLANGSRPTALSEHSWPVDALLEFYLFRLFNVFLLIEGREYGAKERGQNVADGEIEIEDNVRCLYDAKSTSKSKYRFPKADYDKILGYLRDGKRLSKALRKETRFFLIVAPDFGGDIKARQVDLLKEHGTALVCIRACDLCQLADDIKDRSASHTALRLFPWSNLFALADPVVKTSHIKKVFTLWEKELSRINPG